MLVGFAAGLALDLAPPADHLAGRWALALVVVGYVAGRARRDGRPDPAHCSWHHRWSARSSGPPCSR